MSGEGQEKEVEQRGMMEQGHPSHVPKGRGQAGQMGREKCHQLRGELTLELLFNQGKADKWLIHTFFPARIIQAATSQPVFILWCQFHGTEPQTPPDFPAWLPTSILLARKNQGSRQGGVWPQRILCSPACAMRGSITLHKPEWELAPQKSQTWLGPEPHQQTGSTQAFPLPSS